MKSVIYTTAKVALLSTFMLSMLIACDNKDTKTAPVAYVDLERVITGSGIAKQEKAHLDAVRSTLMASAKTAGNVYKTMPEDAKKKAAAADAVILNRSWSAEERKARGASVQAVLNKVEEYRKAHHMPVVMDRTAILAADTQSDISAEIIKSLARTRTIVDYGNLPEIKVKNQQEAMPLTQ